MLHLLMSLAFGDETGLDSTETSDSKKQKILFK